MTFRGSAEAFAVSGERRGIWRGELSRPWLISYIPYQYGDEQIKRRLVNHLQSSSPSHMISSFVTASEAKRRKKVMRVPGADVRQALWLAHLDPHPLQDGR